MSQTRPAGDPSETPPRGETLDIDAAVAIRAARVLLLKGVHPETIEGGPQALATLAVAEALRDVAAAIREVGTDE